MRMRWKKIPGPEQFDGDTLACQSACTGATDRAAIARQPSANVRAIAHRAVADTGNAPQRRDEASGLMLHYRGYQLIEYVMIHHRSGSRRVYGGRGVSIRDDLFGVVGDQPSMDDAMRWVDHAIAAADRMLAEVLA